MTGTRSDPDRLAARATAVGVGAIVLMLTWIVGQRIAALLWTPPVGPTVAVLTAVAVGTVAAVLAGRRLARTAAPPREGRRPG